MGLPVEELLEASPTMGANSSPGIDQLTALHPFFTPNVQNILCLLPKSISPFWIEKDTGLVA